MTVRNIFEKLQFKEFSGFCCVAFCFVASVCVSKRIAIAQICINVCFVKSEQMEFRFTLINWRVKESVCIKLIIHTHMHSDRDSWREEWARERWRKKRSRLTENCIDDDMKNVHSIHSHTEMFNTIHKTMKIDNWKADGIQLTGKTVYVEGRWEL